MRHKQEDQGQDKLPSARLIMNGTLMLLRRYRQRTRNIRAGLNTRAFHLSCQPSYSSGVTTGGGVIPAIKSLKTDAMMVNWTELTPTKSLGAVFYSADAEQSALTEKRIRPCILIGVLHYDHGRTPLLTTTMAAEPEERPNQFEFEDIKPVSPSLTRNSVRAHNDDARYRFPLQISASSRLRSWPIANATVTRKPLRRSTRRSSGNA